MGYRRLFISIEGSHRARRGDVEGMACWVVLTEVVCQIHDGEPSNGARGSGLSCL